MDGRRDQDRGTRRALRCDETRVLLMGYIDGELRPEQVHSVEDHLAVCVDCRGEERAYRRLGEVTEEMIEASAPRAAYDDAWAGIYSRLERRTGWVLMSLGVTLLMLFGVWELVNEFLLDPEVPWMARLGVGTFAGGSVLLLVSFLRERLYRDRTERYREVQR